MDGPTTVAQTVGPVTSVKEETLSSVNQVGTLHFLGKGRTCTIPVDRCMGVVDAC